MRSMAIFALALIISIWSIATVAVDSFARPYRVIAERLEVGRGGAPDVAYFDRVERALAGDWVLSLCSRELVRSAVSIKLAAIDVAYRTRNPAAREAALGNARSVIRKALRCFPHDGNLWLRLAMVERARAEAPNVVQELLRASLAAAPNEGWIMIRRVVFASQLLATGSDAMVGLVRTDARNLVMHGRVSQVAEVYLSVGELGRRIFHEYLVDTDAGRRLALQQSIDQLAANPR